MQALAVSLLADGHRAEDVVQESYLAALRHPPHSADSLRAWLGRVVRNVASNIRRGEARRTDREGQVARSDVVVSTEEIVRRIGVERQVADALLEVSEAYRSALYLRFYEDLPPREIARRLGIPVETVRSRVRRGLEAMRSRLDHEYGGDRRSWCLALLPWLRRPAPFARRAWPLADATLAKGALLAATILLVLPWSSTPRPPLPMSLAPPVSGHYHASLSSRRTPSASLPSELRLPAASPIADSKEEATRAVFCGRVLDARTEEPVPELSVHLQGPGGVAETVRTGWDGCFTSRSALACGTVVARFAQGTPERPVAVRPHSLTHDPIHARGAVQDILAEIGPTLCIRVGLPPELSRDELVAHLWEPGNGGPAIRAALLPPCDPALVCLRFDRLPRLSFMAGGTRSEFVLGLSGGRWTGATRFRARPGIHRGEVELELERAGLLSGRLTDPLGVPCASVPVVLRSPVGARLHTRSDADGFYSLSSVAPGEWSLEIDSARHPHPDRQLVIGRGEELRCDLVLGNRVCTDFRGTLSSRTGHHIPKGEVQLVDSADPSRRFSVEPSLVAGGRGGHSFTFEGIPVGTYTLYPPAADGHAWDPPQLQLELPSQPVDLTCLDDVPSYDLGFRVYDHATGAPIESFRGVLLVDRYGLGKQEALAGGFDDRPVELEFGTTAFENIPESASLWWMIELDGYRAALGVTDDLRGSGSSRFVEVHLLPSWRTELRICTLAPSGATELLEGVHVLTIGGTHLGTSLADGSVYLELGYDPGQLQLECDGWRVHSWEGFWNGRRFQALDRHLVCMVAD